MLGTVGGASSDVDEMIMAGEIERDNIITFAYESRADRKKQVIVGTGSGMGGEALAEEYDVIVIGSGMGGLACGALSAEYGSSVAVLESHIKPGGSVRTCEGTFGVCRLRRHTDERVAFRAPQVFCCIETMMASREQ